MANRIALRVPNGWSGQEKAFVIQVQEGLNRIADATGNLARMKKVPNSSDEITLSVPSLSSHLLTVVVPGTSVHYIGIVSADDEGAVASTSISASGCSADDSTNSLTITFTSSQTVAQCADFVIAGKNMT